jgi:multidrug efflux pump subunit AcrB
MESTPQLATAVLRAANATAVARLLAMLCILSVFTPALIMANPLRSLFMPLTTAVGFALISSYLLSSTFVPIMSVYLVKHHKSAGEQAGPFARFQRVFDVVVTRFVTWRWIVALAYLVGCGLVLWQVGMRLGTELFPQVDSGEFVLRFRPPPGSNYKLSRELLIKCLDEIDREAGPGNVAISLGYAGQVAPNFGMNNMVLFMRGPDDGWLRVALRENSGIRLDEFRERLRKVLPERLVPWMAQRLQNGGLAREEAERQARTITFGFQPGDMVSQVMSFGALTPISVRVVGTDLELVREHALKITEQMRRIRYLRDIQFEQQMDYPGIRVDVDREKAGLSDITVRAAADPVIEANSSSRFIALNYWLFSKTGFDYQVEVLVPPKYMTTKAEVETLPLAQDNPLLNLMIRDVATVRDTKMPGEIDRSASLRYIAINANVEGEDMGRAARQVDRAIAAAGAPPRGVRVEMMGQVPPMDDMFKALGIGLAVAVFVILVLLTAYFQSPRLALISISAVPGVLAGVVTILLATGTTLNIESFMGSIMCIGVSVSNSVMLVTFINEHWQAGAPAREAALRGARERLRPILMTACAMTVGMVPMAIGLERGSQMESPLGRAVIGGLVLSTFSTLLVVPSIFAVVVGDRKARSPSLSPEDPGSPHYDPDLDTPPEAGHGPRAGSVPGRSALPTDPRPEIQP